MSRRDYFLEIEGRRSRLKARSTRWAQLNARLDQLIDVVNFVKDSSEKDLPFKKELAKYISIGFIACLEGYFRLAIRDLVDAGPPFQANVSNLKDVKIDLKQVVEIQKRRATLGEFVSHSISLSNLDDINEVLSTLLGTDFLKEMKSVPLPLLDEPKTLVEMDIADRVMKDVKYSFEHRHLFAHELAPKLKVDVKTITMSSRAVFIFLLAAEAIVEKSIREATKQARRSTDVA
jgi:hypothetical protein